MGKVKEVSAASRSSGGGARGGVLERYRTWFSSDLYKRNQGRKVRQATLGGAAAVVALGVWRLLELLETSGGGSLVHYGIPAVVLAAGLWFSFRLVNFPTFADFLIATEAEMNKVSWPTWPDLRRATAVVIVVLFLLTAFLFVSDLFWQFSLLRIGVLHTG